MSFHSIATRITVTGIAIAVIAGHAAAAAVGDEIEHIATPSRWLAPSEIRFADALSHYCRGLIAEGSDSDPSTVTEQLEEAFRLDPGQLDLTIRLASRYQFTNRTNDLLLVLQSGCARNPDAIGLRYYLAGVYQITAKYDKALIEYGRIIARNPQNAAGYFGKTQTYLAMKKDKKAFEVLAGGLGAVTNSDSLMAMCNQFGMAYLGSARWDDAIKCFKIMQAVRPDDLGAFLNLLEAYLRKGSSESAQALLRTIPAKYRDNPRFDYVVARHFLMSAYYKESLEYFEKVETGRGPLKSGEDLRDSLYYHQYGMACERAGNIGKAEKQFELSVELNEKNADSLNYLAYMWAERAVKLDKAMDYVTRALKINPVNPAFLDTLGWIYFKQGNMGSALEQVEKAHELMPAEAVIAEHLGDILYAMKDEKKAIVSWKESFLLDPASATVAKKLKAGGIDIELLRKQAGVAKKSGEEEEAPGSALDVN
ncbi:MAG: tetratricopeptide repeat protein [bacterium]